MKAFAKHSPLAWVLIGIALITGIWLRTYDLTGQPFWLDEAYSAFAADKGFAFIWNVLPGYETHPPLYSAALRSWILLTGNSLAGFRSFGAIVGILVLPVVWMGARELGQLIGKPAWLVAIPVLLLASVLPSLVDTARLVRPYYLLTLANACGVWSLLRLARLHRTTGSFEREAWCGYLLSLVFLVWLHNMGLLYVAALGLGLIILIGPANLMRRHWRPFLIGHMLVVALASPAILFLLDQAPTWVNSTWLKFDGSALFDNILLIFGLPGIFGGLAAFLLGGTAMIASPDKRSTSALLVIALTPMLLELAVTFSISPVFLPRTLVASGIPLVLLIGAGAAEGKLPRTAFGLLLLMALVRVILVQQLPPQQNWYGAIRWLMPKLAPNDSIYAYPNEGALPLRYALRDMGKTAKIRQIPSEIPARDPSGWYPTGSRGVQSLPPRRLAEIANDPESRSTPIIWLLRLDAGIYDKQDSFLRILHANRDVVTRFSDGNIEIVGLRLRSPQPTTPKQPKP